jgi:hypothetical protein
VAPKHKVQLVRPASTAFQINPLFEYSGLNGVPEIVVQLVLGHGTLGPWPPQTYLLIPVIAASAGGADRA